MKILQLGKFYPIRGGVEKVMYDIMLGLSERNIYCDMLCASTEDHPSGVIHVNSHANVIVVKTTLKASATMLAPLMIPKLREIAANYDIIHIHHPDPMGALALFLSGFKGKVILHWHSDIVKQKKLLKLYKPLQTWLIKRADLIVGTTPVYVENSRFLEKHQHKIDYIPIGVEKVVASELLVEKIVEKYKDNFLVFSLGRLVEYKGFEFLIKSAKFLPSHYKIVIGGKGPLKSELEELIINEGLADKVVLLGYLTDEEANAYFEACDIYVLSSIMKTEAFAIVQIEAMSLGKPVVTAHIPESGVSWVNEHMVSGLVCEAMNPSDLAEKILNIGEDNDLKQKLSEGAKLRYDTFFRKEVMIDKSISLYLNVLSK